MEVHETPNNKGNTLLTYLKLSSDKQQSFVGYGAADGVRRTESGEWRAQTKLT